MAALKLFTDASVNPQSKIGYGAYLAVPPELFPFESLKMRVKVKKFNQTSSTKLELQTLLWALTSIQNFGKKISGLYRFSKYYRTFWKAFPV